MFRISKKLCIFVATKKDNKQFKTNKMKAIPTQQQILDRLISKGQNENTARRLINKNYDYAVIHYSSMKQICECIITIE